MHGSDILLRPVVIEKSTDMQERGRYTFEVAHGSTKLDIKQAVETVFSVNVVKVNTMNIRGKRKRFGPRFVLRRSRKKAIVTLAAGQSITIFEGV
jgi:large subunit ribosomal protein L23